MAEYIEREKAINEVLSCFDVEDSIFSDATVMAIGFKIKDIPAADVQPVVRCKDCKHFHLDYFGEVNGANIIVAHEICDLWAGGCRTMQNAFCSNGVRKDGET